MEVGEEKAEAERGVTACHTMRKCYQVRLHDLYHEMGHEKDENIAF